MFCLTPHTLSIYIIYIFIVGSLKEYNVRHEKHYKHIKTKIQSPPPLKICIKYSLPTWPICCFCERRERTVQEWSVVFSFQAIWSQIYYSILRCSLFSLVRSTSCRFVYKRAIFGNTNHSRIHYESYNITKLYFCHFRMIKVSN